MVKISGSQEIHTTSFSLVLQTPSLGLSIYVSLTHCLSPSSLFPSLALFFIHLSCSPTPSLSLHLFFSRPSPVSLPFQGTGSPVSLCVCVLTRQACPLTVELCLPPVCSSHTGADESEGERGRAEEEVIKQDCQLS